MIRLSIITPYYNTLKETIRLSKRLSPQLNKEVEWIIVDDGCHEAELDKLKAKVIHLENNSGNASLPRNIGLDNATGQYITFIDSDDMVARDYVSTIIDKIKHSKFDYCFFSWQMLNEPKWVIEITDEPPDWNDSIWNTIYSKSLIGEERFDINLAFAEDAIFNQKVRKGTKEIINKIIYYYNNGREDSLTYRFHQSEKKIAETEEK